MDTGGGVLRREAVVGYTPAGRSIRSSEAPAGEVCLPAKTDVSGPADAAEIQDSGGINDLERTRPDAAAAGAAPDSDACLCPVSNRRASV